MTLVSGNACRGVSRADEVTVGTGNKTRRVAGEIIEFNAEVLTIRRTTGREETFLTPSIRHFATTWPSSYTDGRTKMAEGNWREAITDLRDAVAADGRRWAQRQIIADTVRCYLAIDDLERAGATFKVIYGDSRITRHLSALPLEWWPASPPAAHMDTLKSWLEDEPPLQLAAASRLMNSTSRRQVRQVLQDLAVGDDRRIAILATAQLWRDQVATASPATIEKWQSQLTGLSPDLQTGPAFVVAAGLSRHGHQEEAAELLLRAPILYGTQSEVAAQSLFAAGSLLNKLGRTRQAATLYREIVERYPDSPLAGQARQLLTEIKS